MGFLCGCLCGHLVPLVPPVRTKSAERKQLVQYNSLSRTLGAGFLLTLPSGTASSLLWVGQSLGAMPAGVHSYTSRDPLLSAGQSVCNEETTGEPFLAACPLPPMGGGRSIWQLGPAGWLQARSCW